MKHTLHTTLLQKLAGFTDEEIQYIMALKEKRERSLHWEAQQN